MSMSMSMSMSMGMGMGMCQVPYISKAAKRPREHDQDPQLTGTIRAECVAGQVLAACEHE